LHDRQTEAVKRELKWLTGELGPARELQVLLKRVLPPEKKRRANGSGMHLVSRELAKKRDNALTRAQNAVQSERFRALTLDLAAWLEAGEWRTPEDDLVRDRGDIASEAYAATQLRRRRRKVKKKGKALVHLDAARRHKLRIQAKKLRYAAEFLRGLFLRKSAEKRRTKFLAALERLQDGLGELNDIAIDEERIKAMAMRPRAGSRKRAFAAGLLAGREDARTAAAMTAAAQAYADLVKVKPFWR
jgi:CHAD domain-containing protein